MIGNIPSDLAYSDRLIPPGVQLSFDLTRKKPHSFCFIGEAENKDKVEIVIDDIYMQIRYLDLPKDLLDEHNARYNRGEPMIIPYRKQVILTKQFPSQIQELEYINLASGPIPKSLVCGLVSQKSFNGDHSTDPYWFGTFHNKRFLVRINGGHAPFQDGVQFSFDAADYDIAEPYKNLSDHTVSIVRITIKMLLNNFSIFRAFCGPMSVI